HPVETTCRGKSCGSVVVTVTGIANGIKRNRHRSFSIHMDGAGCNGASSSIKPEVRSDSNLHQEHETDGCSQALTCGPSSRADGYCADACPLDTSLKLEDDSGDKDCGISCDSQTIPIQSAPVRKARTGTFFLSNRRPTKRRASSTKSNEAKGMPDIAKKIKLDKAEAVNSCTIKVLAKRGLMKMGSGKAKILENTKVISHIGKKDTSSLSILRKVDKKQKLSVTISNRVMIANDEENKESLDDKFSYEKREDGEEEEKVCMEEDDNSLVTMRSHGASSSSSLLATQGSCKKSTRINLSHTHRMEVKLLDRKCQNRQSRRRTQRERKVNRSSTGSNFSICDTSKRCGAGSREEGSECHQVGLSMASLDPARSMVNCQVKEISMVDGNDLMSAASMMKRSIYDSESNIYQLFKHNFRTENNLIRKDEADGGESERSSAKSSREHWRGATQIKHARHHSFVDNGDGLEKEENRNNLSISRCSAHSGHFLNDDISRTIRRDPLSKPPASNRSTGAGRLTSAAGRRVTSCSKLRADSGKPQPAVPRDGVHITRLERHFAGSIAETDSDLDTDGEVRQIIRKSGRLGRGGLVKRRGPGRFINKQKKAEKKDDGAENANSGEGSDAKDSRETDTPKAKDRNMKHVTAIVNVTGPKRFRTSSQQRPLNKTPQETISIRPPLARVAKASKNFKLQAQMTQRPRKSVNANSAPGIGTADRNLDDDSEDDHSKELSKK
ncbi:unnamed protein product, partial [Protopolystoma xenopodis]